jgi:cytochrome P450
LIVASGPAQTIRVLRENNVPRLEAIMADDASHPGLSPAAPKPAHVPDSLVVDFDLFKDPELLKDPHARALDLVTHAPPVFWTPRQGGHWVFVGHEANFELGRDWESFTSQPIPEAQRQAMMAAMPPGMPHIPQPVPITVDPPEHTKFRVVLNSVFSPKAMNALKDDIRQRARRLIAAIRPQGRAEFMGAVAEPMPVQVFLKVLGLPLERQAEYRAMVKTHLATLDMDPAQSIQKIRSIAEVMRPTFEERRENPQDDMISYLWQAKVDGRPTTMEDMENFGVLLFIAGLDTVMNGIGFGVKHLAQDLPLQQRLRANPELIADAAEELLRRYTFTVPTRKVAKDLTFLGVEMKAGERVDMFLPGADLDPKRFAQPSKYDLDREDKVHIAFATGPHRCVGSHLARIELQILYEELLAGLPEFKLDPEKPPTYTGGHILGITTLDLVWSA